MVSKQGVKVTTGAGLMDTGYWMLDAGLLVTQAKFEVMMQDTRSRDAGM